MTFLGIMGIADGGNGFEGRSDVVYLDEIIFGNVRHDRAAPGYGADHSLEFEYRNGLSDRSATHAKFFSQAHFRQRLAA
jgi:hypothetical protein